MFKKKGLGSHLKHCSLKKAADPVAKVLAGGERRLSTSLPVPSSPNVSQVVYLVSDPEKTNICFQCGKCDGRFKTVQALKTHEKFCKGKPQPVSAARRLSTTLPMNNTNICLKCGDILSTPTGLKVHMLSHK